eukprot:scaffold2571_cov36-Phaeocystis_antarctica.AAC.1
MRPTKRRDPAPRARASSRPAGGAAGGRRAARAVSGAGQGRRPPLRRRGRADVERQRHGGSHAAAPGQSARALCVILEGSLVTARLVGSLAYVAVSTAPRLPEGGGRFSEMAEVDVMPWVGGGGGGGLEPAALCADV